MNILIIYQFHVRPNDAGITRFSQFAQYWAKSGHRVKIIAGMVNYLSGKKPLEYHRKLWIKESEGERIEVLRTFTSGAGYRTFWGRLFSYFSFIVSSLIGGLFFSKADLVIATSPPVFIGIVGYLISFFKRVPFIFEIRDLWPDEAIELGAIRNKLVIDFSYWLEKFLYHQAKMITVVTPGFKEFLAEKKAVDLQKIVVIPNSADLNLLKPANKNNWVREKFNWQDKFIILYIGAHSMVYDFRPIIETAERLKDRENILFVLVGDGKQKPFLIKRVREENLNNVQFLDPVSKKQVADFINASDVCVATLRKMNLLKYVYAAKLFDYMSCAKPIVLATEGVSNELICSRAKGGICVEPENAAEFERAILDLYNDAEKRESLGKNGYQFVKKNFSDQILAAQYEESLRKILQSNR